MAEHRSIAPRGPFSLRAAAEFAFGPTEGRPSRFDGTMRLAFAVDAPSGGYAGAGLTQPKGDDGPVEVQLTLADGAAADAALAQVARTVSLDHDGVAFMTLGDVDPVLGALQRAHRGQRPVLFHSPYEAAAWAVLSARRPAAQGARVRAELGARLGATLEVAGAALPAFPRPESLAQIPNDFPGLNATKVQRLRDVAAAALEGALDVARLHELGPERAYEDVQRLPGIGPFYAGLIVLRATGFAGAPLLMAEPRLLGHAARLYDRPGLDLDGFRALSEHWRPFRTWAAVLIRVAGARGAPTGPSDRR